MQEADDAQPPAEKARLGDIPDLVELMRQFYAESDYPLDAGWAAASFGRLLEDEDRGAAWLSRREGRPAGYVVLTFKHSMESGGVDGFIDDLFVRPDARRQRVATSLLTALFAECARLGVASVRVEVGSDNPAARALYGKFGLASRGHELLAGPVQ